MCGRYSIIRGDRIVSVVPNITIAANLRLVSRFNAAPGQLLPVISSGARSVQVMKWGILPGWAARTRNDGFINARAETIAEKPAFRQAIAARRCLVPADGFYEWKRGTKSSTTPYRIRMRDQELFAMAGIWEPAHEPDGPPTFAIITVAPNELMSGIHDRMPAILARERYEDWLNTATISASAAQAWLKPYPADEMEAYAVGTRINSSANEGPDLIEPAAAAPPSDAGQLELF